MRTSRLAQDTARLFEQLPTRQTRRSALASPRSARTSRTASTASTRARGRGAQRANGTDAASPPSSAGDIEDAIPAAVPGRKRKRAGTATATDAAPLKARRSRAAVKDEAWDASTPGLSEDDAASASPGPGGFPRKPRPQPAKESTSPSGTVTIHPPVQWPQQWAACARMRAAGGAPVDTMGCDRLFAAASPPADQRFQTLIALMLSPQTKDGVTAGAMQRLHAALAPRGGFTLRNVLALDPGELDRLIIPVGFHNTKTKNIQRAAQHLAAHHASDVPDTPAALMALPGVGPKIAYLCLQAAWGINQGIGVDTHVHRITNRWGWHRTSGAEATRAMLERWLPRDRWGPINHMLVGFGQTVCKPIGPDCGRCELAAEGICPSAVLPRGKARSVLVGVRARMKREGQTEVKVEKLEVSVEAGEGEKQEKPEVSVKTEVQVKAEREGTPDGEAERVVKEEEV